MRYSSEVSLIVSSGRTVHDWYYNICGSTRSRRRSSPFGVLDRDETHVGRTAVPFAGTDCSSRCHCLMSAILFPFDRSLRRLYCIQELFRSKRKVFDTDLTVVVCHVCAPIRAYFGCLDELYRSSGFNSKISQCVR